MRTTRRAQTLASAACAALLLGACSTSAPAGAAPAAAPSTGATAAAARPSPTWTRDPGTTTEADAPSAPSGGDPLAVWAEQTAAEPTTTTSSADGAEQRVLYAPPDGPGRPLLVHVHSWSSGYDQTAGIPAARWAEQLGWGFVAPDFRGPNDGPDSTGSALTTTDVLDAVDLAVQRGGVDAERVYVTGYSGGGMMGLLLAGRHPDRFAGVVANVPIDDLGSWYAYNAAERPDAAYAGQITASCGGAPEPGTAAAAECATRSPSAVLAAAREAGVPVYLTAGISDEVVPPSEAVAAWDRLVGEGDRIGEDVAAALDEGRVPDGAAGDTAAATGFTAEDPAVLLARSAGPVRLAVFDGGHEFVYYPGLDWLAGIDAGVAAGSAP